MNCVATSVKDRLTNLVYSLAEVGFFTLLRESGSANAEDTLNDFYQTGGYDSLAEEGIQFDAGCSKIVIYDDYCDYVLKSFSCCSTDSVTFSMSLWNFQKAFNVLLR
jgi:hypothetical protein